LVIPRASLIIFQFSSFLTLLQITFWIPVSASFYSLISLNLQTINFEQSNSPINFRYSHGINKYTFSIIICFTDMTNIICKNIKQITAEATTLPLSPS
jgi:hypothetical protein